MLTWRHEKTLPRDEALKLSIKLSKDGLTHYTSAVDENGNITVKWGEIWDKEGGETCTSNAI